jgi:transposase
MRIVRDETRATDDAEVTRARLLELEATLAAEHAALVAERQRAADLEAKHDRLHEAFRQLQFELELLKRRLFHAKAERIDTGQLELEFAAKLAALDTLAGQLQSNEAPAGPAAGASKDDSSEGGRRGSKGKTQQRRGRRDFTELDLPEERIEVPDLELDGKVERIGTEESAKVMWRRGGFCRVVFARIKYKPAVKLEALAVEPEGPSVTGPVGDGDGPADDRAAVQPVADLPAGTIADAASPTIAEATAIPVSKFPMSKIVTAPMPPMLFQRSLATPSLVAHIASDKWCDGLPLHRQEDRFKRLGVPIDRGTMSRWLEHAGATVGATVVHAMHADAMLHAFCILTDATGVLIQPLRDEPKGDKPRRSLQRKSCRRGHFFVQIADGDHVFFEYAAQETSAAVGEMFRGFTGYIQADAKSVYDLLYRPPDQNLRCFDDDVDPGGCTEVACWSHARRPIWETAVTTKDPIAREGLARIARIFALDRTWKGKTPEHIKAMRELHIRPHVDAYFAFAEAEYEKVKHQRGMLRSALGYSVRQRGALTRFFDDGRLKLTNNDSERELRRVATGRKAWMFIGSDDHAQAAGNLLTLVASARLHKLDPEVYLRDLFRVLPHWPNGRYLELCPRDWAATRARLDPVQLEQELGRLDIPPAPSSEQPASG